jgi:hypothetical protein
MIPQGERAVLAPDGAGEARDWMFRARALPRVRPLRWADLLVVSLAGFAALYLLVDGRWVPTAGRSIALFVGVAVAVPILRFLARTWPSFKPFDVVATLWVLAVAGLAHGAMQALLDGLHPVLYDAYLARADLTLFGGYPSALLDRHLGGVAMDLLLVCYYSYYIWPSALGLWLYFRKGRQKVEHYVLAIGLAYGLNFVFYILVPAIGPRFYLLDVFPGPVHGAWLAPYLDGLMHTPAFMRDCFPSGHTAITLLVLTFAFRYARGFFWLMLPVGLGLITASLAGRFHYGIDVLCAIPLTLIGVLVSDLLIRFDPEGRIPTGRRARG